MTYVNFSQFINKCFVQKKSDKRVFLGVYLLWKTLLKEYNPRLNQEKVFFLKEVGVGILLFYKKFELIYKTY